jgi:hypothetical protein
MAAVRQKEMKVNITLVTTSTCRVVGPRRRGFSWTFSPADIEGGSQREWDVVAIGKSRRIRDFISCVHANDSMIVVELPKGVITRGRGHSVK